MFSNRMISDILVKEVGSSYGAHTKNHTEDSLHSTRQVNQKSPHYHSRAKYYRTHSKGSAGKDDWKDFIGYEDSLELHCYGYSAHKGETHLVQLEGFRRLEAVDQGTETYYQRSQVEDAPRAYELEQDASDDEANQFKASTCYVYCIVSCVWRRSLILNSVVGEDGEEPKQEKKDEIPSHDLLSEELFQRYPQVCLHLDVLRVLVLDASDSDHLLTV